MNKFNFKSLLALALTVMMVLSIVPMTVSAAEASATISFADATLRESFADDKQVWKNNGLTVTNEIGTSTQPIKDYVAPVRFYANTTLTIAYPAMTTVVVKCNSAKYAGALNDALASVSGVTVTVADTVVTIAFAKATDSVTATLVAQVRVDSIAVYVGGAAPDAPDAPEVPESKDPAADSTLTVKEAIALGSSKEHNTYTTGKYYVSGEITEVYNTQYGNMKIKDAEGNILTVYGTYSADGSTRYDAMATKPVAGDTVKVYGIIGQYNGTAQIKNGWIVEHTAGTTKPDPKPEVNDPAADSTLTVKEAIDLGASKEHNTYTAGKYYVSGEVTEIYNTTYGNMKIKDADGNILTVYGTYSADGSTRFDAMDKQPAVGDTVKVYGIIGQYNGTAQIKNGWLVEVTSATPETPDTPDTPVNPPKTGDALIVMIPALMLAGVAVLVVASRKRRFN